MKTTAYEFERNQYGYGVFALTIEDGKVLKREKLVEYDFLIIAVTKLSNMLMATLPDTLKPSTRTGEALPAKKADEANRSNSPTK
jgi:hypothetical protein